MGSFSLAEGETSRTHPEIPSQANRLDQVLRDCTFSYNMVANPTSTSSGVLGILGLVLTGFTAGGSLLLSSTWLWWEATAVAGAIPVIEEEKRVVCWR